MAKENRYQKNDSQDMTLEEAKAYRASLAKPEVKVWTESEKREEFRLFWAQAKRQYGKAKDIEGILWSHLKSCGMDKPEDFKKGIAHFGLKEIEK